MTHEEAKWRKEHDAYEQLRIVLNWCEYEDYDYIEGCGSMENVLSLYLFVNFEIGVEFVSVVWELIEEGDEETTTKAKAWDKTHNTHFWS